jgi:hypothetical protein
MTAGGHHAEHPDVVLKGDAMTSRGDMPHPQYVFSHNPDHGSLFPVAKKKLAGKPQRFEEQKKGLIAPMKDLKIMADDLNVPTQGGRVISEAYRQSGVYVGQVLCAPKNHSRMDGHSEVKAADRRTGCGIRQKGGPAKRAPSQST